MHSTKSFHRVDQAIRAVETTPNAAALRREMRQDVLVHLRSLVSSLVPLLLLVVALLPGVGESAIVFSPTNVVELSLHQTAEIRFQSSVHVDPPIVLNDWFYFTPDKEDATCSTAGSDVAGNRFTVSGVDNLGYTGVASINVRSNVFEVGKSYIICYVTGGAAHVVWRASDNNLRSLRVWSSIYNSFTMLPESAYGGMEDVILSVVETVQDGRPRNHGLTGSNTIFLVPCPAGDNCGGLDALPELCASKPAGRVLLNGLNDDGSSTVNGNFSVPYVPSPDGYAVCIPYCFAQRVCGVTASISYTVVTASISPQSGFVIRFGETNPKAYTVTPSAPQAREYAYMLVRGTGLKSTDEVSVITNTDSCGSGNAHILPHLIIKSVKALSDTEVQVDFVVQEIITSPLRGRVCYRLTDKKHWSGVYKDAKSPSLDFVIDVLQPTGFSLAPPTPSVGQVFSLFFEGTGLNAAVDTAFLTLRDCDTVIDGNKFPCTMEGGSSPECKVLVNPESNVRLRLLVCYRKEGRVNDAQVAGAVTLAKRNPVFQIGVYPLHIGQETRLNFFGTGLSLSDKIQFILSGDNCGESEAVKTFTMANAVEVQAGTNYQYSVVGASEQCLRVCYRFSGSSTWTIVHSQNVLPTSDGCASPFLYVKPYNLRYTLPAGGVGARETVSVTFGPGAAPFFLKLVRSTNGCSVSFCTIGNRQATACQFDQSIADFVSLNDRVATIFVHGPDEDYIICAMIGGNTYIPVLPDGSDAASTEFSFKSIAVNPTISSHKPEEWRVAYASLSTTFSGTGLDSKEDVVYVVNENALLHATQGVCPPASVVPAVALVTTILPGSEKTTTVATHTRSDQVYAGLVVHFCYVWSAKSRVTYAGSITFASRLPSEMETPTEPAGGFRAGMAFTLVFKTNTSALQPATDTVHFFRFPTSSDQYLECYCGDSCPQNALVQYDVSLTSEASDNSVQWVHPRGFDNYDYNAFYIVCYNVLNSDSSTYMGRVKVGSSQPSYYTVLTFGGDILVGRLITLEAIQSCIGDTCQELSSENSMRLIPRTKECYQVKNEDSDSDNTVDVVGKPESTKTTYKQTFVVNTVGDYRVCYRLGEAYQELPFSSDYLPNLLKVDEAAPAGFVSVPLLPSAGQFLIIELVCSSVLCPSCDMLRLVPGVGTSCWEEVSGTFSSDTCRTTTVIDFLNKYLPEGKFTLCYGGNLASSRRVPGTLSVNALNPLHFTPSSPSISVNQESQVTLALVGTGLSVKDKIFLLTSIGFSCHDLHSNLLQNNDTLKEWFAPSIKPAPLQVNAEGTLVTWVSSSHGNRFGAGILSEPFLCDNPGVSCTMQLCYAIGGEAWAPVPIQGELTLSLTPSDPSKVSFEKYPSAVGMYSTVTVIGRNLHPTDFPTVRVNTCNGAEVSIRVGTATVTNDGTKWTGVVRFVRKTAETFVVCYTRGSFITEIGDVDMGGQFPIILHSQLYYMYNNVNFLADHDVSQYELLDVGAVFSENKPEDLQYVELIDANLECNYMPYYNAVEMEPEFAVQLKLVRTSKTLFAGRLNVPAGDYALCMEVNMGVFRVTTRIGGAKLTITEANPGSYETSPAVPFPNQLFSATFTLMGKILGAQDQVQIITGNLYDCGSRNSTIVGEYLVTEPISADSKVVVAGLSLPESLVGVRLTMCYQRTGGTFATVPRESSIDQNLYIMKNIPSTWKKVPVQPQEKRMLKITFMGDDSHPEFLQITDRAFLVLLPDGDNIESPSCVSSTPAITSDAMVMDGQNTVWTIAADKVVDGTYIVCYKSTANNVPVRVENPPLLRIFPTQSPFGIFKNNGDPVVVFSGERFHLMFDTLEPLNLGLSFASDSETKDAVLFSSTPDCITPLTADFVTVIPAEFQYKDMEVVNPSGIIAPYLHLVMRTPPGDYAVCIRRVGRKEDEAFFTYELIGDVDNYAVVKVTDAPISTYVTVPAAPRSGVPMIQVSPTYGKGYTVDRFFKIFFVPVVSSSASGDVISIVDDCYRPTVDEAASNETTTLKTTLEVVLSNGRTLYPFPDFRNFQLCLHLKGDTERAASVHASLLNVLNPSPNEYVVPEIIEVNTEFEMGFRSLDPIFKPSVQGKKAELFNAPSDVVSEGKLPNCQEGGPPPGGAGSVTKFDTFTATDETYATVKPRIMAKAYLFVCFYLQDQDLFFPVPNAAGGFIFSVGLTGAQSYVVAPSKAYMGQQLAITILGNALSDADHVKLVKVENRKAKANYDGSCTAETENADAEEPNGAIGSVVNALGPTQAHYIPRVNMTGRFILCYQSAKLSNAWGWVSDLEYFMVNPPLPTGYLLEPSPSYAMGISLLRISDTNKLLGSKDKVKLVDRATGNQKFDCSDAAQASSSIKVLDRVASGSNAAVALYQVCAAAATSVTLCYLLENGAWSEVPLKLPPPTYLYDPLVFVSSPFSGPTLSPLKPRPYEPFTLTFESDDAEMEVKFVSFAAAPQPVCTLKPSYVTPVYLEKMSTAANTFIVSLPGVGNYQLYLGTNEEDKEYHIAHEHVVTVVPCDPCSFTPSYTFLGNNVLLNFPSSDANTLGSKDNIRIVPASKGPMGNLCDAPTGPFMSLTLSPDKDGVSAAGTVFTLPVGDTKEFLGEYYICYRKAAGTSNYAILVDGKSEPQTLSIYPPLPDTLTICPVKPLYLETVTFSFSFKGDTYPKLSFSESDEFLLLPPGEECGAKGSTTAPGVLRPWLQKLEDKTTAIWVMTLPGGRAERKYQICFRLSLDNLPRLVPPSTLDVVAQDPFRLTMEPPLITPSENFKILIHGTKLSEGDSVYVVDASQNCAEQCGETLNPTILPAAVYTKIFKENKLVELDFTQPLGQPVQLAVCYRRVESLLVRLGTFLVGGVNPKSYSTNFVPRVGTRPLITFVGSSLTENDRFMIVEIGVYCDESVAIAVGIVDKVEEDGKTSAFHLLLVEVPVGRYSVCYLVSGNVAYTQMTDPLEVHSGGPASYTTSNTPMQGRATVITLNDASYTTLKGDIAMVTCADCSCFDGKTGELPYGTPEVTAAEDGGEIKLRVGMKDSKAYSVCYRVFGSGFAQVGEQPIRPVVSTPRSLVLTPSNALQGQRLKFVVGEFKAEDRRDGAVARNPNKDDEVMLVTTERLCWDTESMNPDGVLTSHAPVSSVTNTESTWHGHVPSLGPDALPASSFPVKFILCYRESTQGEYVPVPFPITDVTMGVADPSSFATVPEVVASGMMTISMTFPKSNDGDTAFTVFFAGETLTTNRACDDTTSTGVSVVGPAHPAYIFSLPPQLLVQSLVVCYIRAGATVAEVPKLLALQVPNPGGYTTDVDAGNPRRRQYITITFTGSNLNPDSDSVIFTDKPCMEVKPPPPVSSEIVRRASSLVATADTQPGTSVRLVVQFVADSSDDDQAVVAHICYLHEDVWIEVGAPLLLDLPIPATLTLTPPVSVARVGQHVRIHLTGSEERKISAAAIISAVDDAATSWCQSFDDKDVQEPLLKVVENIWLDVPVWKTAGSARLCVRYDDLLWSDVAPTTAGAAGDLIVLGPNPLSMEPFPKVPRVGQQVSLTFKLDIEPTIEDTVRIASPLFEEACDTSETIPGFPSEFKVSQVDVAQSTSTVILKDNTDPFDYRSFSNNGAYKVCYFSAKDGAWSLVGGSPEKGTLVVQPIAPTTWSVAENTQLAFAVPFVLNFLDEEGNLNADGDFAWAAPLKQSCGVDPTECLSCIRFTMDPELSTAKKVVTKPAVSRIVGSLNLCYRLKGATAALLPNSLEIDTGEVECLVEEYVRVGQEQSLTFRKRNGVDDSGDSWRVSLLDEKMEECDSGYIPDFVEGRARKLDSSNDAQVVYDLEWPVSMVMPKYLVCYTHGGVARPVCTCGQIDAQSGECYVSTLPASPLSFSVDPSPAYVGQRLQVALVLSDDMTRYSITSVKFVHYVDGLTTCREQEAFPVADGTITVVSPTLFHYTFKHDHKLGVANLIVCALSESLSPNYSRVGMVNPSASSNTLTLRPYLTLKSFPSEAKLIRGMETIRLTFTHASKLEDDVVDLGDRITFVDDTAKCVESVIDDVPEQSVLQLFMLGDTSFSTNPAPLMDLDENTQASNVIVTFDPTNGLGERYICYKLKSGTWAPVLPGINVLPSIVSGCEMQPPTSSAENGANADMRAMQYVRAMIVGVKDGDFDHGPKDAVKVIPHSSSCFGDAGVFISGVVIENKNTHTVVFAPTAGDFRVCYRLGGVESEVANWSPVCAQLKFTNPSPIGSVTGCLRLGQTLNIKTTHQASLHFTEKDRFRIIPGTHHCIYADGTQTVAETISIGDAKQTVEGTPVVGTDTKFTIPPVLLGAGSTTMRLCYKDAAGIQFSVPLDEKQIAVSQFNIDPELPTSVKKPQIVTAGHRVYLTFSGAANGEAEEGGLRAYAALPPNPYVPGPAYDGTFDAATAISLGASFPYSEGRCYVGNPAGYGVYGSSMETIGSFDPVSSSMFVACYRLAGCNIADVGSPFHVLDYNPKSWSITPSNPRRAQLLLLTFKRNKDDPESIPLSPGKDLATAETNLLSCWTLPTDSGVPTTGTKEETRLENVFFASQKPSESSVSQSRVCYQLVGSMWSELQDGVFTLQPANPVSFSVVNAPARINQLNFIEFHGTSLGVKDRVKIISKADFCTDSSKPPKEMVSYDSENSVIPGSADGWSVIDVTELQTALRVSTSVSGSYSVCYRLSGDTVWTLVYGVLTIDPQYPETVEQIPSSPAEGELFTLHFTASTETAFGMSETDSVALYTGVVSCLSNNAETDVIIVSPSRTDLLPLELFFQMASGTRGEHTLCYTRGKVIVWGFPTVTIKNNPWNYITVPPAALLRVKQLISAVFEGFGLVSNEGEEKKIDRVKLISSKNPQTDSACETVASPKDIWYSSLTANGTYAVQVVRLSPESVGSYWVCYKLNGGVYHPMLGKTLELNEADPSGATSNKGNSIWDGEMASWTITTSSSPANGAIAYYSTALCNDFPYYVDPTPSLSEFPNGVATVRDGVALLRAGPPTPEATALSLCYYADGVITMLGESLIVVTEGVPPALETPVTALGMQVFQFPLSVTPSEKDYVVLVADRDHCVGETPPDSPASVFVDIVKSDKGIIVRTAVEKKGTFYICYSHRVDRCAASQMECARTIGTVVASEPNPSGWSLRSSDVYTTELLEVTLFQSSCRKTGGEKKEEIKTTKDSDSENLWLSPVSAEVSNMQEVALACMKPIACEGCIELKRVVVEGDVRWTTRIDEVRTYAVCYKLQNADLPTIFPPLSHAVLVVHLTQVTEVIFATLPEVGTNSIIILYGRGLSKKDVLVAVGVPSGSTLPEDICSNANYVPRVTGSIRSEGGDGLTSMVWTLHFETSTRYVLCFRAAAKPSSDPMVLITSKPFDVNPNLVDVRVVSVALKDIPLQLEFRGKGLQVSDMGALVYLTDGVDSEQICNDGDYTKMTISAEDGTSSLYTTVPTQVGEHVVCYRRPDSKPIQMANRVNVRVRNATGGVFSTVPVCSVMMFCMPQPVVSLVDAAGAVTSDPLAVVEMHLMLLNGDYVDSYLSGSAIYTHEDYSSFSFLSVIISKGGEYFMVAKFLLAGGVELVVKSPALQVSESSNQQMLAAVRCQPDGIIPRSVLDSGESDQNVNIKCVITTISDLAPKAYIVQLNAGTSTDVVPAENQGGSAKYTFTVHPPHDQPKIQFVSITVTPAPPLESWAVENSPVIVRIGSRPGPDSTLGCVSNSRDLPFPTMVRVGSSIRCSAQGKRIVDGVQIDIVALPIFMRIFQRSNNDPNSEKAVNIGDYPESLDGNYIFDLLAEASWLLLEVMASVPSSDVSNTYIPMEGSPAKFSVIGEPQEGETEVICVSRRTASRLWFTPVEPFTCTLTLRAGGTLVNGVAQDFSVTMRAGGTAGPIVDETWGSTLVFNGSAAPKEASRKSESTSNQVFEVSVTFNPLKKPVAFTSAVLVYTTSIVQEPASDASTVSLELRGSGLSLDHKYGVRSSLDCAAGVSSEAKVMAINNEANHVRLVVVTQPNAFFLCFAPSDSQNKWQVLSNEALNVNGGGGKFDLWIVLLILGILFLLILLALLIILIWRVCMQKRREKVTSERGAVYFPPRTNDRFVSRPEFAHLQQCPLVGPPLVKNSGNRVRININDHEVYAGDVNGEQNGVKKPQVSHHSSQNFDRAGAVLVKTCDDLNSVEDASHGPFLLPLVPPPRPPSDDTPSIIGAVGRGQTARVDNGITEPRSGPYQYLHHSQNRIHPFQPNPPASPYLRPDAS